MKALLKTFLLVSFVLLGTSFSQKRDKCGCIPELQMTPEHIKCMNSASAFYNCIMGTDIKPKEVKSYGFYIYTGEGTILNRANGDEWNFTLRKYLTPNIKEFKIRGLQLKKENGEAGRYLRRSAKVDFAKNKKKLKKLKKKAEKEEKEEKEKKDD